MYACMYQRLPLFSPLFLFPLLPHPLTLATPATPALSRRALVIAVRHAPQYTPAERERARARERERESVRARARARGRESARESERERERERGRGREREREGGREAVEREMQVGCDLLARKKSCVSSNNRDTRVHSLSQQPSRDFASTDGPKLSRDRTGGCC